MMDKALHQLLVLILTFQTGTRYADPDYIDDPWLKKCYDCRGDSLCIDYMNEVMEWATKRILKETGYSPKKPHYASIKDFIEDGGAEFISDTFIGETEYVGCDATDLMDMTYSAWFEYVKVHYPNEAEAYTEYMTDYMYFDEDEILENYLVLTRIIKFGWKISSMQNIPQANSIAECLHLLHYNGITNYIKVTTKEGMPFYEVALIIPYEDIMGEGGWYYPCWEDYGFEWEDIYLLAMRMIGELLRN